MRGQSGFGLLEAIVALTLIAATGLALFSWADSNLAEASRLRDRDAASRVQLSAVELLSSLNPAAEPSGQRSIRTMTVAWQAKAMGPELPGMGFTGTPTNYRLQLFDTTVDASDARSGTATRFTMTLLGYRSVGSAVATN